MGGVKKGLILSRPSETERQIEGTAQKPILNYISLTSEAGTKRLNKGKSGGTNQSYDLLETISIGKGGHNTAIKSMQHFI